MEGMELHINYLAVFVAALLSFVVGGLWYGPLFGKAWMNEMGFTEESLKNANMGKIYGTSFVLALVISFNLAAFLGDKADLAWGLTAGALAGIGWVAASIGITYLFGRKTMKLFFIDAGYQAVTYTLMGGLLGVWR